MADAELNIVLNATDKTKGAFGGMKKNLRSIGKVATGAAVGGLVAVGGAAIATGIKGAQAFIDFESQMNEVFTLLPGISQGAMDDMSEQVKQLSRDFGVMPDEVVPALYQSISAGVPPDNVFEFMETATKASIGGVTDLETAVDGITSVVNAYGEENVNAAQASDLMFTAVRLGKTNFEELSASLFNVIPTASSLGVGFEEVTAAMATLTSQGTPTSVATTQLRGLMVEASKETSNLNKAIKETTGQGFTDLIKEGATVTDVMDTLRSELGDDEFRNLFGSVEALNAALGITGPNAEAMTENMDEMMNSTGATDAAFEQMNKGIQPVIDKLKALGQTFLIDVGTALAPFLQKLADLVEGLLPKLQQGIAFVSEKFSFFFTQISNGVDPLTALMTTIGQIIFGLGGTSQQVQAVNNQFWAIIEAIVAVKNSIMEFLQPVIQAVQNFVSWKDILIAFGAIIAATIIPIIISLIGTVASILAPILAIIAIVAVLRNAWENDWGGIRTFLINAWENTIKPALQNLWDWLAVAVPQAIEVLKSFWETVLLPALQRFWNWVTGTLFPLFQKVWTWLQETIPQAIETLKSFWEETLLPAIKNVWRFIQNDLVPLFEALWKLFEVAGAIALETLQNLWENVLLPALETVWEFIQNNIIPILEDLWEFIGDKLSPILETVTEKFGSVSDSIGGISGAIQSVIGWIGDLTDKLSGISVPDFLQSSSPTPFEIGLRGIGDAMRQLSTQQIPQFRSQLERTGNTTVTNNNFNLTLSTGQSLERVSSDFNTMRVLAGRV